MTASAFPVEESNVLRGLLERRYSCRGFMPDPVPRSTLERVFDLAQRTPSWCNTQPWQVVVCEGDATRRFADALEHAARTGTPGSDLPFPDRYEGEHLRRRRETGWALYDAVGVTRGDRAGSERQAMRNFAFFGAPVVAVICSPRYLGVYGALDCGLYVQSLLLAATSCGLATIAQAAIAGYSEAVHRHLGISEDLMVICGVAMGFEDPEHPANGFRTSREPVEANVRWLGNE